MTRAVIFDVDGVLVDSYAAHFASWRAVLREHGLDLSEADFAGTFGRTSREIIRQFWGDEVGDAAAREIDERKEALYRDIVSRDFPAMDGAVELIDALHGASFRLAVGSSGPPPNVELTLERLGRRAAFSAVVTGREVTRGKPDPQVFLLAAERLGVEPARCAVVEDAAPGIRAARAAGMAGVALSARRARTSCARRVRCSSCARCASSRRTESPVRSTSEVPMLLNAAPRRAASAATSRRSPRAAAGW